MSEADHWQKKIAIEHFLCLVQKPFICRNLKLTFHFWSIWLYNLDNIDIIDYVLYTKNLDANFSSMSSEWEYENGNSKKTFHCKNLNWWRMSRNVRRNPISQLFYSRWESNAQHLSSKGNPTFYILCFDIFVNRS